MPATTQIPDHELRGRTVIAAEGQIIGEVLGLYIDPRQWIVRSIHVKLDKSVADQIGAKRGIFHAGTIDIPVASIQSAGDTVVLTVTVEALRSVVGERPEPRPPSEDRASPQRP